jgi:hypothetical protein
MALDVVRCGTEQHRVVEEVADARIATRAQQVSIAVALMIVILVQPAGRLDAIRVGPLAANHATTVLGLDLGRVLLRSDPVPPKILSQVHITSGRIRSDLSCDVLPLAPGRISISGENAFSILRKRFSAFP